jgi:predicted DNA-binding protein with PD1-like motif
VIRLEHGDVVHKEIEQFVREHAIRAAGLIVVGGADEGSMLVAGPERGDQAPIVPQVHTLQGVHEVSGTGTVFWDEEANVPVAHIHLACGRGGSAVTGCAREGVQVWQMMEVVLFELTDTAAARVPDPQLGFKVLVP